MVQFYIPCKVWSFGILSILNCPTDYICRYTNIHNTQRNVLCKYDEKILLKYGDNTYEVIQNIFIRNSKIASKLLLETVFSGSNKVISYKKMWNKNICHIDYKTLSFALLSFNKYI